MPIYSLSTPTTTSTTATTQTELDGALVANTAKKIANANANRKQLTIYNKTNATVFFAYGNDVSASNYAFKLGLDGYYEMPLPTYTGEVWALSASTAALEVWEAT